MNPETAKDLLEQMVRIPSVSGDERRLAEYLRGAMAGLGLESWIDEAGNVLGATPQRPGPTVLMVGHLDTVPGDLPVVRTAEQLAGRGSVDAKGPLAAMICAAAETAGRFPGRVVVAGAVEEETPRSRGAVHLGASLPKPDALIIGEPGGWQGVVLGYKGKLDLRYRVTRAATHPSNPEPKATEVAAEFWGEVLDLLGPDRGHGAFGIPGATLVSMHGDATVAELEFCVRTPPGFDQGAFVKALRARARGGRVQVLNGIGAVLSARNDPVVQALTAGVRTAGGTPRPTRKTGTSDLNTLAEFWPSLPMAAYGPGDSALDHSDDEHIGFAEYLRGIDVLGTALSRLGTALRPAPAGTASPLTGRNDS